MVLTIILILLLVGAGLVGALYSSFMVFYTNFGDTIEYNKAYYAAVSALERAELVLRYRKPWFEGTGGWMDPGTVTQTQGNSVDGRPSSFWYFYSGDVDNGVLWNITSRTSQIPKAWEGNVDWMLATGVNAQNWNMLDYINAENFTFTVDIGTQSPYQTGYGDSVYNLTFSGVVRLPQLLRIPIANWWYNFDILDATNNDIWNDGFSDDVVVDRSFRGKGGGSVEAPFQVMSEVSADYGQRILNYSKDSTARESRINAVAPGSETPKWVFGASFSPFSDNSWSSLKSSNTWLNVISSIEDLIKTGNFQSLLWANQIQTIFRLSLLNLLKSINKQIYPYLEYQFKFSKPISDRYYTIRAQGKYGDYKVELLVKKPTIKESILGTFTIIF